MTRSTQERRWPFVSKDKFERVMKYAEVGKGRGGKLATGGVKPTFFADVDYNIRSAREKIFEASRGSDPVLSTNAPLAADRKHR